MCLGGHVPKGTLTVLYGNCRGGRQASGDIAARAAVEQPHLIALVETFFDNDAAADFVPPGYKVGARFDRSSHGGGVIILAQEHLLVDSVDVSDYCQAENSEIVAVRVAGVTLFACYTNNTDNAPHLLEALEQFKLKNPDDVTVFIGDFNVHNTSWLISSTDDANKAGERAQEFAALFDLAQLVDFPTRGG